MQPQVAFQLCPADGTMWLGGFDSGKTTAAPTFTPIVAGAPYYMINVGGVSVGGTALTVTGADFGPTILDTGTTLTFVPAAVLTAVSTAVGSSTGFKQVFGSQTLASGACSTNGALTTTMTSAQIDAALPPIALAFGGTPISIPATHAYLFDQGGSYCFSFADSSQLAGGQKVSLFGNTLLAGMVTIFDLGNKQVGFAPQQGCAEASFDRKPRAIRPPSMVPHWSPSSSSR
jgi:Eukaryotic aspartyl protease